MIMKKIVVKLENSNVHHLIPCVSFSFGNSIFFTINFLFIQFDIQLLSLNNVGLVRLFFIESPAITLFQNVPEHIYKYRFEISVFDYFYRKSFCRQHKGENKISNTNGFVHYTWIDQFKNNELIERLNKDIKNMIDASNKFNELIKQDKIDKGEYVDLDKDKRDGMNDKDDVNR